MQHTLRFRQYREFLAFAGQILPGKLRTFTLDSDLQGVLSRRLRKVAIHGLDETPEIRHFSTYLTGNSVRFGAIEYECRNEETTYRLLRWQNAFETDYDSPLGDLWVISGTQHASFYRTLRRWANVRNEARTPVMSPADRDRLWNNTVGFLQRGQEALERFGVLLKRGVLLMGQPGNGKTTACRWLQHEADRLGYAWRSVSPDMYLNMSGRGQASHLFQLDRPGIILFDDLDHALRDRDTFGGGLEQTTFLSELDGIDQRQGVVYLFTTNAELDDLDPAFRRPGRIDHMIRFSAPNAELRRELITERWPAELLASLDLERAVEQTDGLSFAELDEVKKQLVMNYLDRGEWDWDEAWGLFRIRMEDEKPRKSIGFVPR